MRRLPVAFAITVFGVTASADHLRPSLWVLDPGDGRPTGNLSLATPRTAIVNKVDAKDLELVGRLIPFVSSTSGIRCDGNFSESGPLSLAHGDVVILSAATGRCENISVVSRDRDVARNLSASWVSGPPKPILDVVEFSPDAFKSDSLSSTVPPDGPSGLPSVAEVQDALASLGYDPGPIDNVMGVRTREALAAFRTRHPQLLNDTDTAATSGLWYHLSVARDAMSKAVHLADGSEITPQAVFWLSVDLSGDATVIGGAKASFPLEEAARFQDILPALAGRIGAGKTVAIWYTEDLKTLGAISDRN